MSMQMKTTEQETPTTTYPIQFLEHADLGRLAVPLVRISCCGMMTLEVLQEVESTDPPLGRYEVIATPTLRGRGAVPALMLLKLLTSQPHRFASKDWLTTQMTQEMERGALIRLDTMASQLRSLLCEGEPEQTRALRRRVVAYLHNGRGSGPGYQLAPYPLIWLDTEALAWNVRQAACMERFGEDALPFWERAYALASRGVYLPDDAYSEWAQGPREEVEGMLRQCVHALHRLYLAQPGAAGTEQALLLLRSYWLNHLEDEDALRPLMELLGEQERYQEVEDYYQQLVRVLTEDGEEPREPDARTQDLREFLRTRQLRREPKPASTANGGAQLASDDTGRETGDTLASASSSLNGQSEAFSQVVKFAIIEAVRELGGSQERNAPFEWLHGSMSSLLRVQKESLPFHAVLNSELELSSHAIYSAQAKELQEMPFLELQRMLSQKAMIFNPSHKNDNSGYLLSRRQALLALTSLTLPLLAAPQKQASHREVEEILSSVAISLEACWQLSNESDILAVYSAVSLYLTPLLTIMSQHRSHRKVAARLLAQVYLLQAITARHVIGLQAAEFFIKEAIRHSQISEDPILQVVTFRHLAMIYFYAKRHEEELALYQLMKPLLSLEEIPPLVHSFVYAGLAGTQAINGLHQETLTALALAHETLSGQSAGEARPIYVDYDASQVFMSEGLAYYDLGLYKEAMNAFLQVDGSSPKISVTERGRLEFLNWQALTILRLPHQDRDMQQCIDYWTAAIEGAMTLRSKQRYDEACRIYAFMEFTWPHEKNIIALREKTEQWSKKEDSI